MNFLATTITSSSAAPSSALSSMDKITCNNCGNKGHLFQNCKLPITSYGVISFKYNNLGNLEFLMIRRKDSFGYIDFIRGKYSPHNIEHVQSIVNEMSIEEKERILVTPFNELWILMWGSSSNIQYRNEEYQSSKKFELIKNGIEIPCLTSAFGKSKIVCLKDIVENSNTTWKETEWEFPKGRREYKEKDIDCAVREFEEETGISKKNINIVENILPVGTNKKMYKHKYFLAYFSLENSNLNNFQQSEVSKLEWKTIESCLEDIRPYNFEKKDIITKIYNLLTTYEIYKE